MRIKKFDWSDQAKAPFIKAAQKIIKASPYKDVLRVGSGFAINKKGRQKFRSNRFNEKVTEICGKRSKN